MQIQIKSSSRSEMIDITSKVQEAISTDGKAVLIYSPHTTCGITTNEGHDPDVKHDILKKLDSMFPKEEHYYKHSEGNSDSHLKTVFVGTSSIVPLSDKKLILGTWQRIFLCEFDGPRNRTVHIHVF
jgi:secondary thiamine-phosphate synthase enzyme